MFKNILVAFDGSEAARQGLATGLALAADQQATLFVVNVVEGMPAAWSAYVDEQFRPTRVQVLLEGLRAAAQKVLDEARAIALRCGQAAKTSLVDARGSSAADVILAQAREVNADIVVLGTHGRDGVSRLVTGSTAESVLRHAEVPVLLVRANAKVRGPRIARPVTADCTAQALEA
jgi:nucleotide-binding universal stress UspA family protein